MASRRDIIVLFMTRTVRMFAYGSSGVVLALFLKAVGLSNNQLGLLLTLSLLGDSAISLAVTRWADRVGRRLMLASSCLLMVLAGIVYREVAQPSFIVLLVAATVGVLSPSGNEVGPFMALEQSILAELVGPANRTHVFAWYNLVGYSMTAVGALVAGRALTWAQDVYGITELEGYRAVFLQYALSGVLLLLIFVLLTKQVEGQNPARVVGKPAAMAIAAAVTAVTAVGPMSGSAAAASGSGYDRSQDDEESALRRPLLGSGQEDGHVGDGGAEGGSCTDDDGGDGGRIVSVSSFPVAVEVLTDEGSECIGSDHDGLGGSGGGDGDASMPPQAASSRPSPLLPASPPALDTSVAGNGAAAADNGAPLAEPRLAGKTDGATGGSGSGSGSGSGGGAGGALGLSARSRRIVVHLSVLFATDSFAGGLVTGTLLAYYFQYTYGVSTAYLGGLLFGANLLAAVSSLLSGFVAARIGLINTMVFTHLPSNVFMLLVPLMPTLHLATFMVFIRFSISQMDVAPRTSYVAGVVRPEERTAAMGIVNIAKSIGAAFGPLLTGWLADKGLFEWAFYLCGSLKIFYDLLLLWSFSSVKPEH